MLIKQKATPYTKLIRVALLPNVRVLRFKNIFLLLLSPGAKQQSFSFFPRMNTYRVGFLLQFLFSSFFFLLSFFLFLLLFFFSFLFLCTASFLFFASDALLLPHFIFPLHVVSHLPLRLSVTRSSPTPGAFPRLQAFESSSRASRRPTRSFFLFFFSLPFHEV